MRKKKIVIISIAIVILMLVIVALSGVGTVKETSSDKRKYETIEKHTSPVEAVFDFYGNKKQVIIYDEISFENGTLILADKITDGEHYPELHYINQDGYLTHITHGSYCWTLIILILMDMLYIMDLLELKQDDLVEVQLLLKG